MIAGELRNLHCPDVRKRRNVAKGFAEIVRILSQPVPPLGPLCGSVPELPPHFQPRPDDLSARAGTLLYDIEQPTVIEGPRRTSVLHGMGGVGKSVLAGAFARSSTARRVFGDGVFRVTVSPMMPGLEVVRSIVQLTGTALRAEAALPEAVTALRTWLESHRCLLVLDNVWHVDSAEEIVSSAFRA